MYRIRPLLKTKRRQNWVNVPNRAQCTHLTGGSGGGPAGCTAPPMGPNSFIFAYIFTKKRLHRRSTSPLMGAHPPTGNPGSATASPHIHTAECVRTKYWCCPIICIDTHKILTCLKTFKVLHIYAVLIQNLLLTSGNQKF